jgi:hypothetical protein
MFPWWWAKMFNPSTKNIPSDRYTSLTRAASHAEIHSLVMKSNSGKSPGWDGISVEMMKLLCEWDPDNLDPPPFLKALTILVNSCLILGHTPKSLRMGWITMVPKGGGDKLSRNVTNMRPITILSELSKLTSRLLAFRLGNIILKHPDMLVKAQRGFLREGSTGQCLDALMNMVEDALDGRKPSTKEDLYIVSYDQRKAFDSVSFFAMKATFRRFNLPEQFCNLVMSGLDGSPSRVRTRDGLTKPFYLGSSVRQGDPLSPLIYIMYMDPPRTGEEPSLQRC